MVATPTPPLHFHTSVKTVALCLPSGVPDDFKLSLQFVVFNLVTRSKFSKRLHATLIKGQKEFKANGANGKKSSC